MRTISQSQGNPSIHSSNNPRVEVGVVGNFLTNCLALASQTCAHVRMKLRGFSRARELHATVQEQAKNGMSHKTLVKASTKFGEEVQSPTGQGLHAIVMAAKTGSFASCALTSRVLDAAKICEGEQMLKAIVGKLASAMSEKYGQAVSGVIAVATFNSEAEGVSAHEVVAAGFHLQAPWHPASLQDASRIVATFERVVQDNLAKAMGLREQHGQLLCESAVGATPG